MKKIIPILVLGLSFIFFTAGCVQPETPKANYKDAKVTKVTLQGAEVEFLFELENKNPIDLDVSGYSYKISINNRELVSENRSGFVLPANGIKKIPLPIFVRYDRVFDSIFDNRKNKKYLLEKTKERQAERVRDLAANKIFYPHRLEEIRS